MILQILKTALELPDAWDANAESYFQTREFLLHSEKYNPCNQTYYLVREDGEFKTGAVLYSLPLDLLTFLGIKSPLKMRICGIPCSVSASGLLGNDVKDMIIEINKNEKGLKLFLNLTTAPGNSGANGYTFPSVVMDFTFQTIADYENALRNEYKRRFRNIRKRLMLLEVKTSGCADFGAPEYHLYREVLKRSEGKLETLNKEFFIYLPEKFRLTRFYAQAQLIGWNITVKQQNTLYFFLGGIDYRFNSQYSTYFNLLYNIIGQAVELGAKKIDFGQTAEEPKIRSGGMIKLKYMTGFHSNPIIQKGLKIFKGLLEYKVPTSSHHVFKKVTDQQLEMKPGENVK